MAIDYYTEDEYVFVCLEEVDQLRKWEEYETQRVLEEGAS